MPASLCGAWDIVSNVNFEGYMIALGKSFKHVVLVKHNYLILSLYLKTFPSVKLLLCCKMHVDITLYITE